MCINYIFLLNLYIWTIIYVLYQSIGKILLHDFEYLRTCFFLIDNISKEFCLVTVCIHIQVYICKGVISRY